MIIIAAIYCYIASYYCDYDYYLFLSLSLLYYSYYYIAVCRHMNINGSSHHRRHHYYHHYHYHYIIILCCCCCYVRYCLSRLLCRNSQGISIRGPFRKTRWTWRPRVTSASIHWHTTGGPVSALRYLVSLPFHNFDLRVSDHAEHEGSNAATRTVGRPYWTSVPESERYSIHVVMFERRRRMTSTQISRIWRLCGNQSCTYKCYSKFWISDTLW